MHSPIHKFLGFYSCQYSIYALWGKTKHKTTVVISLYKLQHQSISYAFTNYKLSLIRILCPCNIETSLWKRSAQHPRLSWQYRDPQSIQQVCVSMQWVCIQCFRLGCVVSMPAIGKINAQISNIPSIIIWFL